MVGLEVYALYAGLLYRLRLYHMPVTRNTFIYVSSRLSLVHNTGREVSFNVHCLNGKSGRLITGSELAPNTYQREIQY
jgi:hypothetical protein